MRQTTIIIGALPNDPRRDDLISSLKLRASEVDWDWIQAQEISSRPDDKYVRALQAKKSRNLLDNTTIVKLRMLHGSTANQVHKLGCRIVEAPDKVDSIDQLVNWLVSSDANLVPRREWLVCTREAALLAIMDKLIRDCRWAKDVSGHHFLKAGDLLNQSPVQRSGFQSVGIAARDLLPKLLATGLLLKKGANQGNTPLEYAINTAYLPLIKQAILDQSFLGFDAEHFSSVIQYLRGDKGQRAINAFDGFVGAQTMEQCRKAHSQVE